MQTPEIVLLGEPNSGKTHYAGQLYGRLQNNPGLLKLRGTPDDLSALEDVFNCLGNGCAAGHTVTDTWNEVLLPLEDKNGHTMDLHWPDYGGEQLRTVFTQREVPEKWQSELCKATGWLLLIRLNTETTYPDALEKLANRSASDKGSKARAESENWDANAHWVELLQILLHVAGLGTVSRLAQPRLAVLLSCYDEVEVDGLLPSQVFAERLPLVSAFIESLWTPDARSVWGLSALGCLLEKDSGNKDFIVKGAEYQGWVVTPEGQQDSDLSRPLAWLLEAQ